MTELYSQDPADAKANLETFGQFPYHGRFLFQGSIGDVLFQGYGIEGRSPDTQNRVLLEDSVEGEPVVRTDLARPEEFTGRRDLLIYNAMRKLSWWHTVSNGDQTDTAAAAFRAGQTFDAAMATRSHEDDSLSTPRISGFLVANLSAPGPHFGLSAITKDPNSDAPIHSYWQHHKDEMLAGSRVALGLQTYAGTREAPESFREPPFLIPLEDTSADALAQMIWEHMPADIRVAAAAKTFNIKTGEIAIKILPEPEEPKERELGEAA